MSDNRRLVKSLNYVAITKVGCVFYIFCTSCQGVIKKLAKNFYAHWQRLVRKLTATRTANIIVQHIVVNRAARDTASGCPDFARVIIFCGC